MSILLSFAGIPFNDKPAAAGAWQSETRSPAGLSLNGWESIFLTHDSICRFAKPLFHRLDVLL